VDALQLSGADAPPEGWEVVPSYDAKCLVAYLMGLNQSHPLKDVRSVSGAPVGGASPAAAAQSASLSPAPAGSPAPAKKGEFNERRTENAAAHRAGNGLWRTSRCATGARSCAA